MQYAVSAVTTTISNNKTDVLKTMSQSVDNICLEVFSVTSLSMLA